MFFLMFYFGERKTFHVLMFFLMFYFGERERDSMSGGGAERERQAQNPKRAPGSGL